MVEKSRQRHQRADNHPGRAPAHQAGHQGSFQTHIRGLIAEQDASHHAQRDRGAVEQDEQKPLVQLPLLLP